jgi:hypothetical protein
MSSYTIFNIGSTFEKVLVKGGCVCSFETGILVTLFFLNRPVRIYPDTERHFCLKRTHLSNIIWSFTMAFYLLAEKYLTEPAIFAGMMPMYATAVQDKSRHAASTVWGFIDGTLRRTC